MNVPMAPVDVSIVGIIDYLNVPENN
jgi:microcompartment protein CcmK/EutM